MEIWRYREIPQRGFPYFVKGARVQKENEAAQPDLFAHAFCPYCSALFVRFADSHLGETFGGDGKKSHFKEVQVCSGCGWWRATRYEDRSTPSFREEDIYRGWGSLQEFDLPDLSLPLDDLRNAGRRHIEAYGTIEPSIIEVHIADIFRYAGYVVSSTAKTKTQGVFAVLSNADETIAIRATAGSRQVDAEPVESISAPWLSEEGDVKGVYISSFRRDKIELEDGETFLRTLGIEKATMYQDLEEFEDEIDLSRLPLQHHSLS